MSFLIGENMVGGYGGADILKGCTVDVNEGEIAVIVGPNGAGKSTAMKALLGMLTLTSGSVVFKGKDRRFKRTFLGVLFFEELIYRYVNR